MRGLHLNLHGGGNVSLEMFESHLMPTLLAVLQDLELDISLELQGGLQTELLTSPLMIKRGIGV